MCGSIQTIIHTKHAQQANTRGAYTHGRSSWIRQSVACVSSQYILPPASPSECGSSQDGTRGRHALNACHKYDFNMKNCTTRAQTALTDCCCCVGASVVRDALLCCYRGGRTAVQLQFRSKARNMYPKQVSSLVVNCATAVCCCQPVWITLGPTIEREIHVQQEHPT